MRKKLKWIISFIIVSILFMGVGVFATSTYLASNIKYVKKEGVETTVESALNEVYQLSNKNSNVVGVFSGWKYANNWNSDGFTAGIFANEDYLTKNDFKVVINKTGKYKIYGTVTTTDKNCTAVPQLEIFKNNESVKIISGVKDSNITKKDYVEVDVNEGDTFIAKMKGGNCVVYYVTAFEYLD